MHNEQMIPIQASVIRDTRSAIESGIEYLRICLQDHEQCYGRTTTKNKWWAEQMEKDLDDMVGVLTRLPFLGVTEPAVEGEASQASATSASASST